MDAISKPPYSNEYTALYDALSEAVYLIQNESGRTAVVAYTDGVDNRSNKHDRPGDRFGQREASAALFNRFGHGYR